MADARIRLRERLEGDARILFALLFGSRAAGRERPESDWDLAIYLDDALDADARFTFRRDLLAELAPAIPVDIVILNDAPTLLAAEALGGERIFVRDRSRFEAFFVKTLGLVEDERYFARIHAEARRKRLREGLFGGPRNH